MNCHRHRDPAKPRDVLAGVWGRVVGRPLAVEQKDTTPAPAAGCAPEWMSEKAISIGQYVVSSGIYTVFGLFLPTSGAPVFHDYLSKELEKVYGGMWDIEPDPIKHAHLMIAHIDKKRKELGIDKARDRVLMDMADRQALEV